MVNFLTAFHSDKGIVKDKNQDSLCCKIARTEIGNIAMAVVCDGMGGLEKGELASSTVIRAFSRWFDEELPQLISPKITPEDIRSSWQKVIRKQNSRIVEYGIRNNIDMGTTLTAMLVVDDKFIITVNVGDSRIYKIKDTISILTEDQTIVQFDLKRGVISKKQAENDPRKHILLQCVGSNEYIEPVYAYDNVENDCMYMLCSDGFRNRITSSEIFTYLNPMNNFEENIMKKRAHDLVEINKNRMEYDNISVMLLRTY